MGSSRRPQHSKPTACKVEGNLIEYPLFHFGDRGRPKEATFIFNEETDGRHVRRKFWVGNPKGLPGALAQDCLIALLWLREKSDNRDIHFYIREVTRRIFGGGRDKGRWQQRVKENLELLPKTVTEFKDSFYDRGSGEYVSTKIRPLFEKADLYEHRQGKNRREAWKENVFRLSELFDRNIEAKYFNWIGENYWKLSSGLPRRLFIYVTKKSDGGRRKQFKIGVEKLYPRLPITSKRANDRFDVLARAAKELEAVDIKHEFDNKGRITFTFPPKLKKAIDAPHVDRKTLEDLVVRFYRVIGRDHLSERRLEEGRKILMDIQTEAGVGAERLGQVVDWVLERRETKFKGLHSIGLLEKAWDQALSAILREEKKKAGAIARAKEEAAAREALAERDAARAAEIGALRAGLGTAEREDLRREAQRRFENSPGYTWQVGRLAAIKEEAARDRAREELVVSFENEVLRERVVGTRA